MKQRKVRVPYTNYELPPSAEQGGQFVDFNKVMKRKKVKIVRKKKNANMTCSIAPRKSKYDISEKTCACKTQ